MCFGRALRSSRAHGKLQQGPSGCTQLPPSSAPRGPARDPLSPALHQGRAGRWQCHSVLNPQPRCLVATHVFSQLKPEVPKGTLAESPEKCLRLLPAPGASVLSPWSWAPAGQPHPQVYFGLSAWLFWVSLSAGSSPCVADLSFTKKKKKKKKSPRPLTGCAELRCFAHQGRSLSASPLLPPSCHLPTPRSSFVLLLPAHGHFFSSCSSRGLPSDSGA